MKMIKNSSILQWLEEIIYLLLLGSAFSACISDALARNFIRLIFLLTFVRIILSPGILRRLSQYKGIAKVFAIFVVMMFFEAIYGGHFWRTIHENRFIFMYNILLIFIVGLIVQNQKQIRKLLVASTLSLIIVDFYIFLQAWHGVARPVSWAWHSTPATTAMFYVVLTPCMLIMVFKCWQEKSPLWERLFYSGSYLLSVAALICTQTRGAWLAVALLSILIICYYAGSFKKAVGLLMLATVLLTGAIFSFPAVQTRVMSIGAATDNSQNERYRMWQGASHMFLDYPLLGVGLGNYTEAYTTKYVLPTSTEPGQRHAHNNFVQFFAETGLVGGVTFSLVCFYLLNWGVRRRRNSYGFMFFAVTLSVILYSLSDYLFAQIVGMRVYYLCTGVAATGWKLTRERTR